MFENYIVVYNGVDEDNERIFEVQPFENEEDANAFYNKCYEEGCDKVYIAKVIKN